MLYDGRDGILYFVGICYYFLLGFLVCLLGYDISLLGYNGLIYWGMLFLLNIYMVIYC